MERGAEKAGRAARVGAAAKREIDRLVRRLEDQNEEDRRELQKVRLLLQEEQAKTADMEQKLRDITAISSHLSGAAVTKTRCEPEEEIRSEEQTEGRVDTPYPKNWQ